VKRATEGPRATPPRATLPPTRGRRRVFAGLTVMLPVVALLLLEGGLRLGGYGHTYPLFIPDQDDRYLVVNPQVIRRFMADEGDAPKLVIRPVPFERVKSPDTFRIFLQGGSSAAGYPYGYGASPAGMLQQRLQRTFPERRVEVVTTAVSAVNSYTLLDFVPEILAQRPDAVVIYAGHNEYLGILGVGSRYSLGRRRPLVLAFLRLKNVRILQLGRRLLASFRPEAEARPRHTLMARIAAEDRIPYGSPLYRRGLAQLRGNLRALLRRYREAGVPVYLGTVVSNERDQPPFISGHRPGADVHDWQRHLVLGRRLLGTGYPARALEHFDAAVAIDDLDAEGHFARGLALDELGRYDEALEAYAAARDRDELRFRAPGEVNAILREVAAEEGAHVVEVAAAFHAEARDGIVGHDLILEHLHPNVDGYSLLADTFYRALEEHGAIGSWERAVPREQAREEIPLTEVDRLYGEYRIALLTSDWPFTEESRRYRVPEPQNQVERIARGFFRGTYPWPEAMRRLLDHYRSEDRIEEAAKVAALLADAYPYDRDDQATAAELLREIGRPDFEVYLRRGGDRQAAVQ
jgi:lysophospholipase L1-like esterase